MVYILLFYKLVFQTVALLKSKEGAMLIFYWEDAKKL